MRGTVRDLAIRYLGVGAKKVWLDPTQMDKISKVKTREGIRELIAQGLIKRKFTIGGSYKPSRGPFLFPKDEFFKLNKNHITKNE
ncbi:hypothetical protein DDB_G0270622 [Dictyostelium discoideum AX4]|uniref:Large ribosomal subunit protein eL19 domain-containing protein n=1 Tax=Dictyostelium discoideum TaxID=44689 RepID=Q55DB5_DICDI|nr:hypothetical protein DDB_G0270622 [Dictyostelium discoideum AX4]EAL72661.1 hypothetical protein DDB_G0270622 [Dictyostelium discoideum AX4]|eukprot:XP_646216.1 hypothetical protein DDB_G0270622 [Dictyostelium discoideum AX4]